MTKRLTSKQKRFCEHYLINLNASRAAIKAGYSPNGARVTGCRLLANPNIQAEIQRHIEQIAEKNMITVEKIIQEISRTAFFDPRDLFDKNGLLRDISDLPENVAQAISSFDVTQISTSDGGIERTKRIRLFDKLKALETLLRYIRPLEGENIREGTQSQESIAQASERIRNMSNAELEKTVDERLRKFREMNKERKASNE
jgi:phage terminase small subunit